MNKRGARAGVDLQWVARRGYATRTDFCAICEEEMNPLYSLARLLTANRETAEECRLAALDDCRKASDVFRECSPSWCRRAIIKQAIQQMRPVPDATNAAEAVHQPEEIEDIPRRLLQLRPFERFVFGMAVLERYSARECATLLDCQVRDVERARIAALQFLGGSGRDRLMALGRSCRREPVESAHVGGNVLTLSMAKRG